MSVATLLWIQMLSFQVIMVGLAYFVLGHTTIDLSVGAFQDPMVLPFLAAGLLSLVAGFALEHVLSKQEPPPRSVATKDASAVNPNLRTAFIVKLACSEVLGICGFALTILTGNFAFTAVGCAISAFCILLTKPGS